MEQHIFFWNWDKTKIFDWQYWRATLIDILKKIQKPLSSPSWSMHPHTLHFVALVAIVSAGSSLYLIVSAMVECSSLSEFKHFFPSSAAWKGITNHTWRQCQRGNLSSLLDVRVKQKYMVYKNIVQSAWFSVSIGANRGHKNFEENKSLVSYRRKENLKIIFLCI